MTRAATRNPDFGSKWNCLIRIKALNRPVWHDISHLLPTETSCHATRPPVSVMLRKSVGPPFQMLQNAPAFQRRRYRATSAGGPTSWRISTWKHIQEAIAAFDYKPSQIARSLKGGRTRLIGMVVADVTNPYSIAVLRGAEDECQRAGYVLALCNSNGSHEMEQALLAGLLAYQIEGLILNSAGGPAKALSDAMPNGLPVVLLDRTLPSGQFDFVGLSNVAAAEDATRHLVSRGYGDIALLTEPMDGVSVRLERAMGFCQVIKEAGCSGDVVEVYLHRPEAMREALTRLMAVPSSRPKAVIAASGLVTLRAIAGMQRLGLRMPDDLGLVGIRRTGVVAAGATRHHDDRAADLRNRRRRRAQPVVTAGRRPGRTAKQDLCRHAGRAWFLPNGQRRRDDRFD